jgi:hypothetical protein
MPKTKRAEFELMTDHYAETLDDGNYRYDVREVVGVFHDEAGLVATIDELERHGFDRAQFSVLGDRSRIAKRAKDLEDDPDLRFGTYVAPQSRGELQGVAIGLPIYLAGLGSYAVVVASGGTLAFALAAMLLAGTAGGGIGGLLAHSIARRHHDAIARQLEAGGLLLWAGIRSDEQQKLAIATFRSHGASDVHLHEIARTWGAVDIPLHDVQPDPFLENPHHRQV